MKKPILLYILIGFLVSIHSHSSVFAQTTPIELATGDYPPFTSQKSPENGVFSEIVSAAFKELEIEVKYTFFPWKRGELYTQVGKVFATFPYARTKEREKNFDFSDAVMSSKVVFFYYKPHQQNKINYEKLEDLKLYTIGGIRGHWYEPVFQSAGLEVHYVTSEKQSIGMLKMAHVDLAPINELVGWEIIKNQFPDQINSFATFTKPLKQNTLHLMISRKYPGYKELTQKFNGALIKIRNKGIYQQLLAKDGIRK